MFKFIFTFKILVLIFFQNYSIRVVDNLGYNLGSYLISDKNDRQTINQETINFSDFVRYIQKNQNETTIEQYNDLVNKMARIELNRARKKYETTFPPNEVSPIFLGSNNFDTCIIFTTDLPVNIYGSRN